MKIAQFRREGLPHSRRARGGIERLLLPGGENQTLKSTSENHFDVGMDQVYPADRESDLLST
jgi:hypothetical protein